MKKFFIFISLAFLLTGVAGAAETNTSNSTATTATTNVTTPSPQKNIAPAVSNSTGGAVLGGPSAPKTTDSLADKTLHFVDGTSVKMSELKGKWILVNYWAVWCGPCHEEIPELNRLAKNYANKIKLYGVNPEPMAESQLAKQIGRMQIAFPVLTRDSAHALGVRTASVLPTTYIINPEGKVVKTLLGAQTVETILSAINSNGTDE